MKLLTIPTKKLSSKSLRKTTNFEKRNLHELSSKELHVTEFCLISESGAEQKNEHLVDLEIKAEKCAYSRYRRYPSSRERASESP